jgi:hypothetical protein
MNEKEFIEKFLSLEGPVETNPLRLSTLSFGLRGARKLAGRDIKTGAYLKSEFNDENFQNGTYFAFEFTGLINYLVLLEQIGSIFRPKDQNIYTSKNGITCALTYFSNLQGHEIHAIKSLRNSLTHKFGLATEKQPTDKIPRKFTISREESLSNKVVELPVTNWTGDFLDKSQDTSTTIYLLNLIDLIEGIYKRVVLEQKSDNLELALNGGIEELKVRYTIL